MTEIILKQKTKDTLKAIDATIRATTEKATKELQAAQIVVNSLNAQKSQILSSIMVEREVPDDVKMKINENYDLIQITEEEYRELTADPRNTPIDTSKVETSDAGKKTQGKKK